MRRRNIISVGIKYTCHHNKRWSLSGTIFEFSPEKKKTGKEKVQESNKKRFSCWSVNTSMYSFNYRHFVDRDIDLGKRTPKHAKTTNTTRSIHIIKKGLIELANLFEKRN